MREEQDSCFVLRSRLFVVSSIRRLFFCAFAFFFVGEGSAQLRGDLDGDGVSTVRDLAKTVSHINGVSSLTPPDALLADLDGDGIVNALDRDLLVQQILGTRDPESLPLSTVRSTSPESGEARVAVTRETVVRFTIPLSLSTVLTGDDFYAEFGGDRILSRAEISGDRMKATLFYLEPLPSNALVHVTLRDPGTGDLLGRPLDLDSDGEPGGNFSTSFETLGITPVAGTGIVGRVFASEPGTGAGGQPTDVPLAGVTITVDGAEETLRTVTDAQGNFTLSPCPAGEFFVKIDGRTSPLSNFPSGDYYPFVGKQWSAEAGQTNNLAGGTGTIFLPCVCSGALKNVSTLDDTNIAFPQEILDDFPGLIGTSLNVPANSLFANDGTRGGMVGIAPVAPTRLPEPLPPGLDLPLVITIQTDGATNFDQPVPVCFPNLPDPTTGIALAPGEKSALWSFDHDTGQWEVAGSMTVSADGLFVKTDPGVGVRQPGWHGTSPGCQGRGNPPVSEPESAPDMKDEDGDNKMSWARKWAIRRSRMGDAKGRSLVPLRCHRH